MQAFARWKVLFAVAIALTGLSMTVGCGNGEAKKEPPPPEQKMLDNLDSDDPDRFLEGVDEARDKYGTKDE